MPKLGDYAPGTSLHTKRAITLRKGPITISSAAFIDYGSFSSLAPIFDSEGGQIGRETLGLVVDLRKVRRRKKLAAIKASIAARSTSPPLTAVNPFPSEEELLFGGKDISRDRHSELGPLVNEFLPKDMIQGLLDGLDDIELEDGVSELLVRNGKALRTLQELQESRFRAGTNGKEVPVEVGGEEWELGTVFI